MQYCIWKKYVIYPPAKKCMYCTSINTFIEFPVQYERVQMPIMSSPYRNKVYWACFLWVPCKIKELLRTFFMSFPAVANFIVPDWGDKVDSGTGPPGYIIGWRPVRQPYAGVNFIPRSGTMNSATVYVRKSFKSFPFSKSIPIRAHSPLRIYVLVSPFSAFSRKSSWKLVVSSKRQGFLIDSMC